MNTFLRSALLGASLCGFANAQVVLNEISYDAPGSDALQVFVEIYGPAGTDVGGWQIVAYEAGLTTGSGAPNNESFTFPMGTTIPNDGGGFGVLVVADGDVDGGTTIVPNADFVDFDMDLENGGDSVVLADDMGTVVDAVGYGDADAAGIGTTAIAGVATGQIFFEGNSTRDFFAPLSIQRCPSGLDTDDNLADFTPSFPTPGVAQANVCSALQQNPLNGNPFNSGSIAAGDAIGFETFTSFGAGTLQVMLTSITDPEDPMTILPPGFPVFGPLTGPLLNGVNSPTFANFFYAGAPGNFVEGNQIVFDIGTLPPTLRGLPIDFYFGHTNFTPTGFVGSTNFATVTVNP